jgi:hypothetical protein
MGQTKVTFLNKSYDDYKLTPPGGASVALKTNKDYTSTQTGFFKISNSASTDIVIGAFGGTESARVTLYNPSVSPY